MYLHGLFWVYENTFLLNNEKDKKEKELFDCFEKKKTVNICKWLYFRKKKNIRYRLYMVYVITIWF